MSRRRQLLLWLGFLAIVLAPVALVRLVGAQSGRGFWFVNDCPFITSPEAGLSWCAKTATTFTIAVWDGATWAPLATDFSSVSSGSLIINNGGNLGQFPGVTCSPDFITALASDGTPTCSGTVPGEAAIPDSTVMSNISGATGPATANTIALVLDKQLGSTQGSIAYRNSGAWVALNPGATGQVLATQGGAANPQFMYVYRNCTILLGADNGLALVDADIGPQGRQCFIPAAATVREVTIVADSGSPIVMPRKITAAGASTNLLSVALTAASFGVVTCANAGGTTGLDGVTTCSGTLTTTAVSAGDWIDLGAGTAGGVAKRVSISITYTMP